MKKKLLLSKIFLLLALAITLFSLSSCESVSTSPPLGQIIEISAKDFNGVWVQKSGKNKNDLDLGIAIMKVGNPQKGELHILIVNPDTLETNNLHCLIRRSGTVLIANLLDPDNPDSKQRILLLLERIDKDQLAIRIFSASGVREVLGIKAPTPATPSPTNQKIIFKDDSLILSKAQKNQFETWLKKLSKNKQQDNKLLEKVTCPQEEQIIFTRQIHIKKT